jgi:hypothetical protein
MKTHTSIALKKQAMKTTAGTTKRADAIFGVSILAVLDDSHFYPGR